MKKVRQRAAAVRARLERIHHPRLVNLEGRVLLSGVDVTQYHNDPYLTGDNLDETTLTPSNVNPTDFGLLFSQAVDGYIYAEPLYMSGLTIDGAVHNVAFVATENDTVYAFDADSDTGADAQPLWVHSFTDPANGVTAVPQAVTLTHDIVPVIGITGTPVIDPATDTLYVVTNTQVIVDGDTADPEYVQTLHALNVLTGQEVVPGGYVIGTTTEYADGSHANDTSIQVPGTGDDSVDGVVTFNCASARTSGRLCSSTSTAATTGSSRPGPRTATTRPITAGWSRSTRRPCSRWHGSTPTPTARSRGSGSRATRRPTTRRPAPSTSPRATGRSTNTDRIPTMTTARA